MLSLQFDQAAIERLLAEAIAKLNAGGNPFGAR